MPVRAASPGQAPAPYRTSVGHWAGPFGRALLAAVGSGGGVRAAQLLLPPVGLAALQLRLGLGDEGRDLRLLRGELALEARQLLFAALDLLLADLDVGLEAGLALLD